MSRAPRSAPVLMPLSPVLRSGAPAVQRFAFPRGAELPPGLQFGPRTDIWAPLVFSSTDRTNYFTLNMSAVARLAPGVAPGTARAELVAFGVRRLQELRVPAGQLAYTVVGLEEQAARPVRRGLLVLLGAVGFVLLIACTTVSYTHLTLPTNREV